MENLIDFTGVDGLQRWLKLTFPDTPIGKELTNFGSFMSVVPDLSEFELQARKAGSDQEKDAIYSKALIAATRKAAPIAACAWTSSNDMVTKGLKWFEDQITKENPKFISWHKEYEFFKKNVPTVEQLMDYQTSALEWRRDTGYSVIPETATLTSKVVAQFSVPGVYVVAVQDMIKDMVARRGGGPKRGVSDEHIRCCLDIMNGNYSAIINPSWGELDKKNKQGLMLLATGFAKLREVHGPVAMVKVGQTVDKFKAWCQNQDILDKTKADEACNILEQAVNESLTLGGGAAIYRNQVAQIDTVFSSYYWMWRAGVTSQSFPLLSDFLFELGQNARGNIKVVKALERTGLKWSRPLLSLFADNTFKVGRIHMHPAVLTVGRLSEMGACFGIIPATHPQSAVLGSGFAKNILNVKTDGLNPSASLVVQLFDIQRQSRMLTDLDVVSSEHLLHQVLVGKKSAYQNAFQVRGNATDTKIVGFDPPKLKRGSNMRSSFDPKKTEVNFAFEPEAPIVQVAGLGPIRMGTKEEVAKQIEDARHRLEVQKLTEISEGVMAWEQSKRAEMSQKRKVTLGGPTTQTQTLTIQEQTVTPGSSVPRAGSVVQMAPLSGIHPIQQQFLPKVQLAPEGVQYINWQQVTQHPASDNKHMDWQHTAQPQAPSHTEDFPDDIFAPYQGPTV
ncbi:nucleoprotein [Orthonairovirus thiaforaense]|uniref:Nucleoprotein n=1 Tax=Orthonairovirus thiaforaense TaxID=3052537 RepID=A0A0M3SU51_9VIRU|nr:nucleoprotein [Orthonairovirus thiaforaense]ALD84357.1 nucleoprotein [Orthonairovirus thiaforaense]